MMENYKEDTLYESQDYAGVHVPCPDCGSSDALVVYTDHSHCYACGKQHWLKDGTEFTCVEDFYEFYENKTNTKGAKLMAMTAMKIETDGVEVVEPRSNDRELIKKMKNDGTFFNTTEQSFIKKGPIKHRALTADTIKKYDTLLWLDEKLDVKYTIFQHKNEDGSVRVQKLKGRDKSYVSLGTKDDTRSMGFFGQHLFPSGSSKKLTVTEGEEDAMAVYQMNGGFPAVSLPNGAQSVKKLVAQEREWLAGWDEIVLCFDMDGDGRKAAMEFARAFPRNTKIMNLGEYKDANHMLIDNVKDANIQTKWNKLFYAAQTYAPKGVITGAKLKELALSNTPTPECFNYPWDGLNRLTFGWRRGELWVWTAHSKVGKTTVMREIIHNSMKEHDHLKFGAIFLEDNLERNTKSFVSTEGNKPFHIPDCDFTQEEYQAAVDRIDWDRISLIQKEALNGKDFDEIIRKVEEMIHCNEVDMIVLDNLMALATLSTDGSDKERQRLNELIGRLVALAETENVHIAVVAHLNREDNIYGTGNIEKIGHGVIRLTRDKKHKDRKMRDKTLVWVEHNRFCGYEEEACWLAYNKETGRLKEEPFEPDDELGVIDDDSPVFDNTPTGATFD